MENFHAPALLVHLFLCHHQVLAFVRMLDLLANQHLAMVVILMRMKCYLLLYLLVVHKVRMQLY